MPGLIFLHHILVERQRRQLDFKMAIIWRVQEAGNKRYFLYTNHTGWSTIRLFIDKVLMELQHRFGEPRPVLQSIAALSPKCPTFLEPTSSGLWLWFGCTLQSTRDCQSDTTTEEHWNSRRMSTCSGRKRGHLPWSYTDIQDCPDCACGISISRTVILGSQKGEKSYLQSTMGQQRLNDLAILAIERDFSKCMDFESVVDNFMYQNPRRIQLQWVDSR